MTVSVRFRFNKRTGEVEEFLVDDHDHDLPEAEHDRIALGVARVIATHPQIQEVVPGAAPLAPPREPEPEAAPTRDPERTGGSR